MPGSLSKRDRQVVWHPFTHYAPGGSLPPIPIISAKGALLAAEDGRTYIDAISSWWVSVHGHCHEHIIARVTEQLQQLDHVIFSGFTHGPGVSLAEQLLQLLPGNYDKIFYSDNGSTAVEVALKMALQYWWNKGTPRRRVIAFRHAYHGDTFGAMAVGERGGFNRAFESLLFDVSFIDLPCKNNYINVIQQFKNEISSNDVAAFIFEPLILGSGGMLMYQPEYLDILLEIAELNGVITIADEVMTGFYRTGTMFACEQLQLQPGIVCLSKGLSAGIMPLGATACTKNVYDAFVSDDRQKTFYHGHSYTGNPMACAAGLAGLELFLDKNYLYKISYISKIQQKFKVILDRNANVVNARLCGVVLAFDVKHDSATSYFNELRDRLYQAFLDRGVLLRPLGNTVYIMPPYVISEEQLHRVHTVILEVLDTL
jgi:adenosylmethionine---8-amino-7-oxononanoate aminotransferase